MAGEADTAGLETRSEHACFGGVQGFYAHRSRATRTEMRFAVFVPPQAKEGPVPVLTYLAGLTCTEETFPIKAGAQRVAADLGLMLVAPDTSPRGAGLPGEDDDWDFGTGAGFYLDAIEEPWSQHYRMYSYVTGELADLIAGRFPADMSREGIFGHSMGGHGALVLALKQPGRYRSLSAFAPVASMKGSPWGQKALVRYLGADPRGLSAWDACDLVRVNTFPGDILIDQGLSDPFLTDQLRPELFEAACREAGQKLTLRRHDGFDHGYYFISTFMEDHLRHHAAALTAA